MEEEQKQELNIKFNFKRSFLMKFLPLFIIAFLFSAMIFSVDDDNSIGNFLGILFIFTFLAAFLALIINYFHKWIWQSQHKENKAGIKENQDGQNIQEKSSFEKQVGYWALLSLIFGILSLFPLPIVHVLAIIFGIIALQKKENKAFAIAGIILGGSILIFTIINRFAGY